MALFQTKWEARRAKDGRRVIYRPCMMANSFFLNPFQWVQDFPEGFILRGEQDSKAIGKVLHRLKPVYRLFRHLIGTGDESPASSPSPSGLFNQDRDGLTHSI